MPRTPLLLLVMAALTSWLTGCDSQASQEAEAQRHLDSARAILAKANAGYVAHADEQNPDAHTLLVYRQETMDAAFEDLNKVLSLDAPEQKIQAHRLAADINASAAQHIAREAAVENAALAGRSTVLLGYLSAMEGSSNRAEALLPQTDEQISKLQDEIKTQTTRQKQLADEVAGLDDKLQLVTAEVEQFKARANEVYAKAQALREQAFVATGDSMYDLQDQAAELDRSAAIESASAEQRQVQVNDLTSRLALSRVQLDTVNKLLGELNQQVSNTRADTERLADASNVAVQAGDQAAEALAKEYTQLADVYDKAVETRMKLAGEKADQVVDALQQASKIREAAPDLQSIKLQLLSAYVDQAHIAASHADYVRDLANTTRAVLNSVGRVAPQDTQMYTEKLSTLTDAHTALRDKADAAIEAGTALASELAPEGSTAEDGDTEAIALKQIARLENYKARL